MSDQPPNTAARPVWLSNLLCVLALLTGAAVILGLATLFDYLGWRVALYITAGVAVAYGVFLTLAFIGYLLYLMDQEVRRGLRR